LEDATLYLNKKGGSQKEKHEADKIKETSFGTLLFNAGLPVLPL
jgi:hypothetical protein